MIILVAHPKKGDEFSNDMVSGSGDITNAVDVVMAYRRKENSGDDAYNSDLIITKNRLTGVCVGSDNPIKLSYGKRVNALLNTVKMFLSIRHLTKIPRKRRCCSYDG